MHLQNICPAKAVEKDNIMHYKITNGAVSLGGETVLAYIDFEICDGEKIAVVGRNGAGKTTLLKCITGEVPLEEGTGDECFNISKAGNPVVGHLAQITFTDERVSMLDEILTVFKPLLDMEARIESLRGQIETEPDEKKIQEYSSLNERFELLGGYTYKKEYSVMIKKFGFSDDDMKKPLKDFSGGQRTKIAFCKLLLSHPDILLLDEPTNHLDIAAVRWLEEYIKSYKSAVVIVSHDRMFIEKTAEKIYEIEYGETHRYKGNFSDFERQKKETYEKQIKDFEYQKKEIQRLTKLVERFRYKATKAAFAQSKLKQIERMQIHEMPDRYDLKTFHADFLPDIESGKRVLRINDLEPGYNVPLAKVDLELFKGEKLGIIGENGIGKSTLLKTLMGEVKPVSGEFVFGENVRIGYFDQKRAEYKSSKNVVDDFHDEFPGLTDLEVRNDLGAFMFSGDDVFKLVDDLSGGERVRLALCKMFKRRPNLLILDEPTNHMDIVGRETLENMLREYTGTVILVSHDRYFINKVADRLLVFDKGSAVCYPCRYEEYEERLKEGRLPCVNEAADATARKIRVADVSGKTTGGTSGVVNADKKDADNVTLPDDNGTAGTEEKKKKGQADFLDFKERSKKEKRAKKLVEMIEEYDKKIAVVDEKLSDPAISSDYEELAKLQEEKNTLEAEQEKLSEEWIELEEGL